MAEDKKQNKPAKKTKNQLQGLKVTELQEIAKKLGAQDISGMKKQELIFNLKERDYDSFYKCFK